MIQNITAPAKCIYICLALTFSPTLLAAQGDNRPEAKEESGKSDAETNPPKQTTDESTQRAGRKITTKDGDEIFLPSEEISEDFAVSFPVDI